VSVGADPRIVADAIVAAAYDPTTPLHVPVGDDAEMFVALWDQTRTYEKWMDTAIPAFETTAGRRPTPSTIEAESIDRRAQGQATHE
jgi:hypothetical protein